MYTTESARVHARRGYDTIASPFVKGFQPTLAVRHSLCMPEGLLHYSVGQRPTYWGRTGLPEGLSQHHTHHASSPCERLFSQTFAARVT